MKASLVIGVITFCLLWCTYAYEPSLYEAERLQTAEKLLWAAPHGMQKDIEQKLLSHANLTNDERKSFCVQYLLYQLKMIAKSTETVTTSTHIPGLVTQVIDHQTFTINVNGEEKTINIHTKNPLAKTMAEQDQL